MAIDVEYGTTIKVLSNDRFFTRIYEDDDGDVFDSEDSFICNVDDEDYEEKLADYEKNWYANHLNSSDYASMLNCDEDDVDDCMGNYFRK